MKTNVQLSRDDLQNKFLILNNDFCKNFLGQIVMNTNSDRRVVNFVANTNTGAKAVSQKNRQKITMACLPCKFHLITSQ